MTMTSVITSNSSSVSNPSNRNSRFFPPCTSEICGVAAEEKERVAEAVATKPTCEITEQCVQSCAAYGKVCPCAARIAAHAACDAMRELSEGSRIFPQGEEGKPPFPRLNAEDIVIGEKLGEGGFSNVNSCVISKGEEAGQEFAVKYLKRKAMVDLHQFKHGAADLAVEAFFLQFLKHPNIVTLHGVTSGSVETNLASGKECGFFIVVDRLVETLETRLERWRDEKEQNAPPRLAWLSTDYKNKKRAELHERIKIAMAIADAMEYLHSLGIVFRDLKPDNMGFDKDGVLKIFDFGLAKELKPGMQKEDGKYNLTGNTGSRRYMAPEVARETPYNQSVDVYSFGILLWELCSGEKPFYGYSSGKHMQKVVLGGERPSMDSQHTGYWPANLQWLMNHCWAPFPVIRPSFRVILDVLQDVLDGKETVPAAIVQHHSLESPKVDPAIDPPSGGFSSLKHSFSKGKRHETTGNVKEVEGHKSKKNGTNRSRSWGFITKR